MTYNLDFGRVSNIIPAHDDAVSTLAILSELGILISGSWDCSVKQVPFVYQSKNFTNSLTNLQNLERI